MAKIAPFRGWRYNKEVVGDLNKVVTQPYDKIDDALREEYLRRSEYNLVRIIKGPALPDDTVNDNPYTRAAEYWNRWIEDRVLIREAGPALYPYTQEFTVEGKTYLRKGLIALVSLEDNKSAVRAHEKTLSGPKADRLKLMRATEANDGQIFMLYNDPEHRVNNLLEPELAPGREIMQVTDDFGAVHRLYRLTRPGLIRDISEVMEQMDLFIADGHHRYETAVNYMNECKSRNWKPVGVETFTYRMMTLVNMHDPGLVILPTHRLVHSITDFSAERLLSQVAADFDVVAADTREALFAALDQAASRSEPDRRCTIGFGAADLSGYRVFTYKHRQIPDTLVKEPHSAAWKALDVNVLHLAILERFLGIDAEKLAAETNIHYVRSREEALDRVGKDAQAAFLLNPTRVEQVVAVASAGERMPQKSTDFFPKLLSGMVLMKMTIDKSMGLAVWQASD